MDFSNHYPYDSHHHIETATLRIRDIKRRTVTNVRLYSITLINTGAAFMGAREWDEETSINL